MKKVFVLMVLMGLVLFANDSNVMKAAPMDMNCNLMESVSSNETLTLSDLLEIYKKKDRGFAANVLKSKGYKRTDEGWKKGGFSISYDGKTIRIEALSEDAETPFPNTWYKEISKYGYKKEDTSVGMVIRTDYHKQGMPIISIGCVFESWVFSIGGTADM